MSSGRLPFLRLSNLAARTRLAPVLVLCLVCPVLPGVILELRVSNGRISDSTFWHSPWFVVCLTAMMYGLVMCLLVVEALRRTNAALLAERENVACLQQACEQEHALNEWKDSALQDLNHELRIPLTQTDGYLELLETCRGDLDAATQAQFIALARAGCDELLHLIKTTTEKLQSSGEQQAVQASLFSLRHEVHTALAHCDSRLLLDHPVELNIADSMYVYADACYVRQVMRNLLTNACKYTPAGTPIIISAALMSATDSPRTQAGMVCVRVRDQGPGIPLALQARVFERFTRLPNATTGAQPGSGLGLAICKQLVEAMGGTIWVESTGRAGEESCFSFTLASGSQSGAPGRVELNGEDNGKARLQEQQKSFAASVQ